MYSTACTLTLPEVSAEQHASLRMDAPLLSLYEAFGAVPDPRSRHGQRYDLPYLLTCLVAALLCNCNSLEAVGQWCRDEHLLLRRLFGARDFSTPTGSLYRRLLSRLSVEHIELVLAAWVQATRPAQDEEAVALDGKAVRGEGSSEQKAPHLLSFYTHESQETLLQVRVSEKKPMRSPSPKPSCRACPSILVSTRLMLCIRTPPSWRSLMHTPGPVY
jgi:DDE_Tnp_1-associated